MEHKALAGQNYYIDILGSDEIYPKQIMHHVPPYLRGIHKNDNYLKMTIKRRDFRRPGEGSKTLPLTRYPRFLAVHLSTPEGNKTLEGVLAMAEAALKQQSAL